MIRITGQIRSTDSVQLDGNYGPYNTTQEAHEYLSSLIPPQNKVGVTVGIEDQTTHTIEEYWYQGGTTETHLVKKETDTTQLEQTVDGINENYLKAGQSSGSSSVDFDAFADTIHNNAQILSSTQKQQARQNIDAQKTLESGVNIKTINGESLIGSGNITIDYSELSNQPQINSVALSGNKSASALGLATAAQGEKADNAILMPTGGSNEYILAKDSNETAGVKWVLKPTDGKSAYEIWLEENGYSDPTTYNEEYFLASLKAQFGSFVPADYGTDGKPASGGTDITADSSTTNYIYLVDNLSSNPTAKVMWITVVNDSVIPNTYSWQNIGEVQVSLLFASEENLNDIYIDNTNLVNPKNASLAKAEDVLQLKAKLEGATASETKVLNIQDWHPENKDSGFYKNDGSWSENTTFNSTRISVVGYKSVRFLGYVISSTTVSYGFTKEDGSFCEGYPIPYLDTSVSTDTIKEYIKVIPDDAVYLVCLYKSNLINQSSFYCYLQKGESVGVIKTNVDKILNDLYTHDGIVFDDTPISEFTKIGSKLTINSSTGLWYAGSNSESRYIEVVPGEIYKLSSEDGGVYAFLKNVDNITSGGTPAYSEHISGRQIVTGEAIITIPEDTNYLWKATKTSSGTDITLNVYKGSEDEIDGFKERLDSLDNEVNGTQNTLGLYKEVYGYAGQVYEKANLELELSLSKRGINSAGNWNPLTDYNSAIYGITPNSIIKITNKGTISCSFAILTDYDNYNLNQTAHYATGCSRQTLSAGNSVIVAVPDNGNYLYRTTKYKKTNISVDVYYGVPGHINGLVENLDKIKEKIDNFETQSNDTYYDSGAIETIITNSIGNELKPLNYDLNSENWEQVKTLQQLNTIKKLLQLSNLKWTPKANVPYRSESGSIEGSYPAGVQITGAPYSSVKELNKFIGIDVSIHTFMTAVNNKYSLLYTENVKASGSTSVWGKQYHGTNCATYYGTVCSELSSYVLGWPVEYSTGRHDWLADYAHKAVRLFKQDRNYLQIGDILVKYRVSDNSAMHCVVVIGIQRDSDGNVTVLKIGESTDTCVQIHDRDWQLNTPSNGYVYIAYRSVELYRNVNYEPSIYVALTDFGEIQNDVEYNNDICCFAGDKATFREGDLIAVDYNLDDNENFSSLYVGMKIEKQNGSNWTVVKTIDLSNIDTDQFPIPSPQIGHVVNLGTELEYGNYRACLVDSFDNTSDYTEWEIIDTENIVILQDDLNPEYLKFSFTSNNATPVCFKICNEAGGAYLTREFTKTELDSHVVDTDIYKTLKEQNGQTSFGETVYLKVVFDGKFGSTTNIPIQLDLE